MNSKQHGFTLVELVVVIVILGILAATALPKFIDLKSDAGTAAASGVAGALASASAINYAGKMAGKTVSPTGILDTSICATGMAGNLLTGGWPTGFSIAALSGGAASCTSGGSISCTVTESKSSQTATAVLTCY